MGTVLSVLFAVLTAASNGAASVLQRRAALRAPDAKAMRLSLFATLLRQKVWLAGVGMVVLAALCQAAALATGPIAVVQPIFVIELPLTLLLGSFVFQRVVPRRTWYGVAAVTAGLALVMVAAQPSSGREQVAGLAWVPALLVTAAFEALLVGVALRTRGRSRAALLGLAAACAYALTAALMKDAMARLENGLPEFLASWQVYGTAAAGVGALFLLQNALQAGSLAASQPMLTMGDALISTYYGITLYEEVVRTGWWVFAELFALVLIAAGLVELARSLAHDRENGTPKKRVV